MGRYSDEELVSFLQDIDALGDVDITDWEAKFIESILGKHFQCEISGRVFELTPKQRDVIEGDNGLMAKYMPF